MYLVVRRNPRNKELPETLLTALTVDECRKYDDRLKDELWYIEKVDDEVLLTEVVAVIPSFKEILVITQESGFQLGEPHIVEVVLWNDLEIGKQMVEKLNKNTDLPYNLARVMIGRPQNIQ